MIRDPMGTIAILLAIEAAVLLAAEHPRAKPFFRFLPTMFWIYFLPMVANTAGLLSPEKDPVGHVVNPVYGIVTTHCLPGALVLLLLAVDVRAILRLGPVALGVMLAGSAGIVLGGPIVLLALKPWLPEGAWMGLGSLSASWIGGSANMIAVKESLHAPDEVFLPMVVVDTICPYVWMGLLILFSGGQAGFDRWNRSRTGLIEELRGRSRVDRQDAQPASLASLAGMLALAAGATFACLRIGRLLPEVPNLFSAYSWTILLVTAAGVALSFTPARNLERFGASRLGYALLYLVLASIGARTSLRHLASAPVLIAAGFLWLLIHAGVLLAAGRLLRAPLALLAAASQANIGGPASAPVVAEIYHEGLAPVGLLLAVLGGILGTYLGLVCATLCRLVAGG